MYKSDKPETSQDRGELLEVPAGKSKAAYGISHVDEKWGLGRPVVVLGYHCAGRAVSMHSDERAISHIIACYQRGKNTADTRQMLMRAAGYTREVSWEAWEACTFCGQGIGEARVHT